MSFLKSFCCLAILVAAASHAQQPTDPPAAPSNADAQAFPAPAHIGGPVTPPRVIHSPEPQTTLEAEKADFTGNVLVYLWVDENGNPSHIRVVKGLGMGLDEKALEAVRQYKFKPATRDGKPIKVDLYISVNFKITHKQD